MAVHVKTIDGALWEVSTRNFPGTVPMPVEAVTGLVDNNAWILVVGPQFNEAARETWLRSSAVIAVVPGDESR